ncbi:MAG: hypothetical protein ACPGO5_04480 [Patescibacteria group bacterium]
MPKDLLEQKVSYGTVRYEWDFPEFIPYERGRGWYITAGVLAALLLIFSWSTANFWFAVFVILVAFVIWFIQQRKPRMFTFKIADEGLVIENLFYAYDEIRSFWIVSEADDDNTAYFEFKAAATPRLGVPFIDIDPNRLQTFLEQYIQVHPEREGRPISESIARLLRL